MNYKMPFSLPPRGVPKQHPTPTAQPTVRMSV